LSRDGGLLRPLDRVDLAAPFKGYKSVSTQIVSSGTSINNSAVTSGTTLEVASGGTMVSMTLDAGGSALIEFGGTDLGTTIAAGGYETVSGTVNGDAIYGTQLVSFGSAVANNETVYSGGAIDLFLKGGAVNDTTVLNGGTLAISGNASATDTTLSAGALLDLQSPKANFDGTLTFDGAATLQFDDVISAGYGDLAIISGFGAGSIIDERAIHAQHDDLGRRHGRDDHRRRRQRILHLRGYRDQPRPCLRHGRRR
jgi:autotransporter passenger strand-loop-strand repeat protein